MELIKVETKEIVNSALKEELNTLNNLFSGVRANQKYIARTIGQIIVLELYKDDFDKLSDFLRYIGLNKSTASQFKNFVECVDSDLIESEFTYSQIIEMLPLKDAFDYSTITLFTAECFDILPSMTCRQIREIVKEAVNVAETAEAEAEESEAEAEESEAESEESEAEAEEVIDYSFYIEYLTSLEVGTELTKEDVRILKMIAKELR